MASAFDDLVERLLYDVALAGDSGLGIQQLANATVAFYSKSNAASLDSQLPSGEDLLFSEAPHDSKPVVDNAFVELVWQWVSNHPEVTIRQLLDGNDAVGGAQEKEPQVEQAISLSSTLVEKYAGKSLITGEERIWVAITGHGIDSKRIPPLDFECLKCIASHGPTGVVQPDVTKETGQDKRSVPKRTDNLVRGGYVTKSIVIARGAKTSLLRLMKFANEQDLPKDDLAKKGASIIQYNVWFDETMRLMKDNDGIIAFEDLRDGLGILGKRFETRALHRCIRRLAQSGLLRKLRARVDSEVQAPDAPVRTVRSLQLLRDPIEMDRTSFMGKDWSRNKRVQRPVDIRDFGQAATDGREDNVHDGAAEDDVDAEFELDDDAEEGLLHSGQIIPSWNRDRPFTNFVFDIIAEAGQAGITSAEMYERATGAFWKRAMDEILSKITDMWQHSQPPHLRHFTIVKDTGMSMKQPVFRFRSRENFQKAVDVGEASWENVLNGGKNTNKKQKEFDFHASPDLDEWGFPKLPSQIFVGKPGQATLQECRNVAPRTDDNLRTAPASKKTRKTATPKSSARPRISSDASGMATPKKIAKKPAQPGLERRKTLTKVQRQKLVAEEDEYSRSVRALAERRIRAEMAQAGPQHGAYDTNDSLKAAVVTHNNDVSGTQTTTAEDVFMSATPTATATTTKSPRKPSEQKSGASAEEVDRGVEAQPCTQMSTPSRALKTSQNTPGTFSSLPKKRGRPTKAMVAERERLQREAEAQAKADKEFAAQTNQTGDKRLLETVSTAEEGASPLKKRKHGRQSKAELLRLQAKAKEAVDADIEQTPDTADQSPPASGGLLIIKPYQARVVNTSKESSAPNTPSGQATSWPQFGQNMAGPVHHGPTTLGETSSGVRINDNVRSRDAARSAAIPPAQGDFEARVKVLEDELRAGSKPGVYINLARANRLKAETLESIGRRPKALTAVFKLPALKELPWFSAETEFVSISAHGIDENVDAATGPEKLPSEGAIDSITAYDADAMAVNHESPVEQSAKGKTSAATGATQAQAHTRANSQQQVAVRVSQTPVEDTYRKATTKTQMLDPALRDGGDLTSNGTIVDSTVPDVNSSQERQSPKKQKRYDSAYEVFRKKTIMGILHSNDGIFPVGRPFMCAFATAWRSQFDSNPDDRTVEATAKNLTLSGKIKKIAFTFQGRDGKNLTRWLYALREISSNSPKVFALQKAMKDGYPAYVMPEAAFEALTPDLKALLNNQTQVTRSTNGGPAVLLPKDLPHLWPHYEDDFPKDLTVTVKRTSSKPSGFAPTEAEIQKFRDARQEKATDAAQKRNYTKYPCQRHDRSENELDEDEIPISQEQSVMQGEIQLSSYQHEPKVPVRRHPHARISRTFKFPEAPSAPIGLPGRVLKRKAAVLDNADQSAQEELRARALAAVSSSWPSRAAHTQANPDWLASAISQPLSGKEGDSTASPVLKRRHTTRSTDRSEDRAQTRPEVAEDRITAYRQIARPHSSTSFGVLVPKSSEVSFPHQASQGIAAEYLPTSLREILKSADVQARNLGNRPNEATTFFDEVERVEAWERNTVWSRKTFVRGQDIQYINYTTPTIVDTSAKRVRFEDSNQDPEVNAAAITPQSEPGTQRQYKKRAREGEEDFNLVDDPPPMTYRYKSRKVGPVPARIREDFDTANASPKTKKRDRRSATNFSDRDYDRLTKAVALVGAVVGGLAGRQNWYIVAHVLSYRYDSEFLRHRWDKVRKERDDLVKQMQERMWEPFLEAYERGALPHVDFTTLRNTDWPALLEWVETKVLTADCFDIAATSKAIPEFPASSKDFVASYDVEETDWITGPNRDAFFTTTTEKMRQDVASTLLNGHSLKVKQSAESRCKPGHMLLRSWIRAIALTEDVKYDAEEAHQKVTQFSDETVAVVCEQMTAEKYVHEKKRGRRLPGRNLDMVDDVFRQFRRWPGKEVEFQYLPDIATKRMEILNTLRRQDQYQLSYTAGDEEVLVLTNMVAQGLLNVSSKIPERNDNFDAPYPRISAWGYSGSNYNVRMFDKSRLRFPVIYEKTSAFTFDHGLRNDIPIPTEPPLYPGEIGVRRPIWVDIHGNMLPDMFEATMRSVLHLLVFRPGITAFEIEGTHKQKLWVWEIELMMPWMEAVGLAKKVEPDSGREVDGVWKGGWRAGEWWYCALCHDVASAWKDAGEKRDGDSHMDGGR